MDLTKPLSLDPTAVHQRHLHHSAERTYMRTIADVIRRLPSPSSAELPAPAYTCRGGIRVGLAVESMRRHMTDEGWQIFAGLEQAGYRLCGYQLPYDCTNVNDILLNLNPSVVVLQDKREWDVRSYNFREPLARFHYVESLARRQDVFKVTILKDSQQNPLYHRHSAEEIGCHAWIIYYHPRIVKHVAPYVRSRHLIRTYHSLDSDIIPAYSPEGRNGTLLSGAISRAYPLRRMLVGKQHRLPETHYLEHPGYHRNGCATPDFLRLLTKYKVAICTSSVYGYALRKIIEATACGCMVITDLPQDEVLPEIDGNLIRIPSMFPVNVLVGIISRAYRDYDPEKQEHFARLACAYYDYRRLGNKLAEDIEQLRSNYGL